MWYQSRKVVLFLLKNVWFDCREWSDIFLSLSKNQRDEIFILKKLYSSFYANTIKWQFTHNVYEFSCKGKSINFAKILLCKI